MGSALDRQTIRGVNTGPRKTLNLVCDASDGEIKWFQMIFHSDKLKSVLGKRREGGREGKGGGGELNGFRSFGW